jgi:hypothetical protein
LSAAKSFLSIATIITNTTIIITTTMADLAGITIITIMVVDLADIIMVGITKWQCHTANIFGQHANFVNSRCSAVKNAKKFDFRSIN